MAIDLELAELRRNALERHLRREIEGGVAFDAATRKLYATDASIYQIEPLGVVLPRHRRDLQIALQIAAEHAAPLTPRGGGTSLSGQAIGPALVIDGSKSLNRILEIDPSRNRCRVEPGVVLSDLNAAAARHGLQFGPDVSTANRATLGGMIGNNSAGAHSLRYGKTVDHVLALETFSADGKPMRLASTRLAAVAELAAGKAPEGLLALHVARLVERHADEIDRRFPKILRRVSGYNLPELLAQVRQGEINLASLVTGSEGTLAMIAEAELNLVELPRHRALLAPHFDSMDAALEQVGECLAQEPAAVELLDRMVLDLARGNLALARQMRSIAGRPAAVLLVEFTGQTAAEARSRAERLAKLLQRTAGVTAVVRAYEAEDREPLWRLREAGLPLLMGLPGDRKPVAFVEDTAVSPERLPEFARRFKELIHAHGAEGAFYGHASVGCLHIRPVLNLKDAADVATMRKISEAVVSLVLEFGGSLSGEHGDGLARSEWNRRLFGDEIYGAFLEVKRLFDPEGRLNPGKIVTAPRMDQNLRLGPAYHAQEPSTLFDFSRHGGMARHVELCSGTGVCRKTEGGAMCPSYRATRDEAHSTRGRANALRWALAGGHAGADLRSDWLHEILELCLSCKACKSECPSNVDMAKLKAEALEQRYRSRSRPLSHRLLARLPTALKFGAAAAPLANRLANFRPMRWLLEATLDIDARRSLPTLHFDHFRRRFRRRRPSARAGAKGKVLLLDDCFTTYQEPQIGEAAVRLLERAGFSVELLGVCCGRPLFSKGMLTEARKLIQTQAPEMAARVQGGIPIVGIEPSCLLSFRDEWPELAPSAAARSVAESSFLLDAWIEGKMEHAELDLKFSPGASAAVYHGHCHQRALTGTEASIRLLQRIPDLELTTLDAGCCGMAGSFGYEKGRFDLSVNIAELALLPALAAHPKAQVVAAGTSCRHQIGDLAKRAALHPLELLARQLAD